MAKEEEVGFSHESLQDAESIGKYLMALAEGFRTGRLRFQSGGRELTLDPRGLLKFELDAQRKGERVKVELKLAWKQADPDRAKDPPLVIDAAPPPAGQGSAAVPPPTADG